MQTNRKQLGIIIIIVGFLILVAIIYFAFFRKTTTVTPVTTEPTGTAQLPAGPETGTTTPGDKPRNYQQYNISKEAPHEINGNDLAKIAMSFSERLGSYSNQSNYGNFLDLKIFMTDSLKSWADNYVATLKEQTKGQTSYYGISTKAITSEVKSFDNTSGTAEIVVTTERRESTEKIGGGEAYLQKVDIGFLKVNGEWLVDKAYWEKK